MNKRIGLIIFLVLVALALFHPKVLGIFSAGANPFSVAEVKMMGPGAVGQPITVEGRIATGSVSWDESTQTLEFSISDNGDPLEARYHGRAPETFRPGNQVVVEGQLDNQGVLEVNDLNASRAVCAACH